MNFHVNLGKSFVTVKNHISHTVSPVFQLYLSTALCLCKDARCFHTCDAHQVIKEDREKDKIHLGVSGLELHHLGKLWICDLVFLLISMNISPELS